MNRIAGERGFCGAGAQVKAARAALHFWEEPCLSGTRGSGTVFFSHCTMQCVYCQNHAISTDGQGKEIAVPRLCEIFLELQSKRAHNINLVTPTHYIPQIIDAVAIARQQGLALPVVYNSSGYEKPDSIRLLRDTVDIFLPDFKYADDALAVRYSHAPGYAQHALAAIAQMLEQVGDPVFDDEGMMQKGVIVRHLMLPGKLADTKRVLKLLYDAFGDHIYISLMNQYTPLDAVQDIPELNHPVDSADYDAAIDYAVSLGVENGFIQEEGTVEESFIPAFNGEGI